MGRIGEAFTSDGTSPSREPDRENYDVPAADDLRVRLFALMDKYIRDHGIEALIPRESRPYEYRTPEERGEWRDAVSTPREDGTIDKPSLNNGLYFSSEPTREAPKPKIPARVMPRALERASELPEETRDYQDRAMAASIAARNAGVTQDQPIFATPKEYHEADQARQQEEFNKVNDFIYRQRRKPHYGI